MSTLESKVILESKPAKQDRQLAKNLNDLWIEARKLKANEGARRLELVCANYENLSPETTYRWIDPVGFQYEVEDALAHKARYWHITRNCVSVLPLILTWLALYFATTAYHQDTFSGDAGRPFLQLWQEGFHGATILTFSTAAIIDVVLLGIYFVLIGFTSWWDSRAYTRSTKFAQELQAAIEKLMVAKDDLISSDQTAIANVSVAVQKIVDKAMEASKKIMEDAQESMKTFVQTSQDTINNVVRKSEDSVNQLVSLSRKSIVESNERVDKLYNNQIMPMMTRFNTDMQTLHDELTNYQGRLDDLTRASQDLASASNILVTNANRYKTIGENISDNISKLNQTQENVLGQIRVVADGVTTAAEDMNRTANNMLSATTAVNKVATQLSSGIQTSIDKMTNRVESSVNKMHSTVEATMNTMNAKVEATMNKVATEVRATADSLVIRMEETVNTTAERVESATSYLGKVGPKFDKAATTFDNAVTRFSQSKVVQGKAGSNGNQGIGGIVGWFAKRRQNRRGATIP